MKDDVVVIADDAPVAGRAIGLRRNPNFLKLWAGKSISMVGSLVTSQALPMAAVIVLSATPGEMGLLGAVSSAPVLFLGLLAGVWVDRLRRRPIMIAADLGRALLLASIPAAFLLNALTIWQLYIVAAMVGVLNVFFNVADQSLLPTLIEQDQLMEGNSRLNATDSVAEIIGPSLGGFLVQAITAPLAILVDAVSFLVSAVFVGSIKVRETIKPHEDRQSVRQEVAEGLRLVRESRVLRALAAGGGTLNFFGGFFAALYALYIVRDLNLGPAVLGVLISAGGAGALIGSLIAGRVSRRFGFGRTLAGSIIFSGIAGLVLPFVHGGDAGSAALLMASQFVGDITFAIYFITEVSVRQATIPPALMGRANATMQVLAQGALPIGALVGGALGGTIGARGTFLIAILGIMSASMWFAGLENRG